MNLEELAQAYSKKDDYKAPRYSLRSNENANGKGKRPMPPKPKLKPERKRKRLQTDEKAFSKKKMKGQMEHSSRKGNKRTSKKDKPASGKGIRLLMDLQPEQIIASVDEENFKRLVILGLKKFPNVCFDDKISLIDQVKLKALEDAEDDGIDPIIGPSFFSDKVERKKKNTSKTTTIKNLGSKIDEMYATILAARKAEPEESMRSLLTANGLSTTKFGNYRLPCALRFSSTAAFDAYVSQFSSVKELIDKKNRGTMIEQIKENWNPAKEGIDDFHLVFGKDWMASLL